MIVLGIETSGLLSSLALRVGGRCVEERFLSRFGTRGAQALVPEAVALTARHGLRLREIGGLAISIGPGSFTGLRVGLTFAKTLAYASGAVLASVETCAAIACNTPAARRVVVVADAQRGGVILVRYQRGESGVLQRIGNPALVALVDLPNCLKAGDLLTGGGVTRVTAVPDGVALAPPQARSPRASVVAWLGEVQLAAGNTVDPWTVEPLYVRRSGAEETAEAKAGRV